MAVNLKQNADLSMGLQGTDLTDGEFIMVTIPWNAVTNTAAVLVVEGPVLTRRMIVKSIQHVTSVAAANAVTATIYKAPSGTALGSGTALHSGTANLQATAATPVSLTLSTTSGVVDVAAGSRIGAVISGAVGATGVGCITVTLAPA